MHMKLYKSGCLVLAVLMLLMLSACKGDKKPVGFPTLAEFPDVSVDEEQWQQGLGEEDPSLKPYDFDALNEKTNNLHITSILSTGMVLQQKKEIIIEGLAPDGEKVSVTITRDKDKKTLRSGTATAKNKVWKVSLPSLDASYNSYTVTIEGAGDKVIIRKVLVGEVWIAAGQSNMEFFIEDAADADKLLSGTHSPYIRIFMQENPFNTAAASFSYSPAQNFGGGRWVSADNTDKINQSSAVGFAFAKRLFAVLNQGAQVPVGIISAATGGSSIHAWLSRDAVEKNGAIKNTLLEKGLYTSKSNYNSMGEMNYDQISAQYNHKIAPLKHYQVQGMIWCQGENDVDRGSGYYKEAMTALANSYSQQMGNGQKIALMFTGLTPWLYGGAHTDAAEIAEGMNDAYKELKSAGYRVGIATIYDVNPEYRRTPTPVRFESPIHPRHKTPVGNRLADLASNIVYGRGGIQSAPVYKSMTVSGNRITIAFDNVKSLKTTDGSPEVRGFTICGGDKVYIPAKAVIKGNTVEVWNDSLPSPVGVTYAFSEANGYANLSSDSLPAAPFRTDRTARRAQAGGDGAFYAKAYEFIYCDDLSGWQYTGTDSAAITPYWRGTGAGLSADTGNKAAGKASIKVTYSGGGAYFEPVTSHLNVLKNAGYEAYLPLFHYKTVGVKVSGNDGRAKTLTAVFTTAGGEYTAGAVSITAGAGFGQYTFDLTQLTASNGSTLSGPAAKDALTTATGIRFVIGDSAGGSINIDDITFGF